MLVQQVLPTPVQEEDRKWLVDEIQRDPLPAALITVAADAGLREALPAIRHALTHPALDVSDAACDAVAQLGDLQSVPALRELAKRARSGAAERALIELEPK